MLETFKLSKTLKSSRDDFNVSSVKTAINPYTLFNVFSPTPGPITSQHDTRILIASYL